MSESLASVLKIVQFPNQPMEFLRKVLKDSSINADAILSIVLDPRCGLECYWSRGHTPLMLACLACRCDVMKALIAAGAEVNNKAAVHKRTPLHMATIEGSLEAVALLIENGADVNATDVSFKLPLHFAVENGHTACAELLLAKGTEVNVASNPGQSPLHLAAEVCDDCARLLLSKGADVTATDTDGETPLHRAALCGHSACAELLVSEGANVLAKDTNG